jgi:glycosyltransferase involved in cell wall biosynthesis
MSLIILLTVHQFFPDYKSGTEVLTYSVAKDLLKRGHKVYVLTGYPAPKPLVDSKRLDQYEFDGIHVYRFSHSFVPMGDQGVVTEIEYNNRLAARYFSAVVRKIRPDVIHFFHLSRLGMSLVDVALEQGIPAYMTPTDFWAICPTSQLLLKGGRVCKGPNRWSGNCVKHVAVLNQRGRIKQVATHFPTLLASFGTKLTASGLLPAYPMSAEVAALSKRRTFNVSRMNALGAIISPTRFMTETLVRNGVRRDLIIQSTYGIEVSHYVDQRIRSRTGPINFGFIGTLAPHKGCHVLIEAFKRFKGHARLKIYGNKADFPSYFSEIQALASDDSRIAFCGTFPNAQIAAVLDGIDALVVPSVWYENAPLVIFSALAAKCPVIASNFPGMSELVRDRENGLLFESGNVAQLEAHIAALTDNPDLLIKLSKTCKVPKSTEAYVSELLDVWQKGLETAKHRAAVADAQDILPMGPSEPLGHIAGWACTDFGMPAEIRVMEGEELIGRTTQFHSRPDVKLGFERAGERIRTNRFGFSIPVQEPEGRAVPHLVVLAQSGRSVKVSLEAIPRGTSAHVGSNDYVGIDEIELIGAHNDFLEDEPIVGKSVALKTRNAESE